MASLSQTPAPTRRPAGTKSASPKPWTIEPIFQGTDVFVIGSGYSLRHQDPRVLKDKNVIVVNRSHQWAPFAQVLFWMDPAIFEAIRDGVKKWKGLAVTTCEISKATMPRKIKLIKSPQVTGLCTDPTGVASGKNSGHAAINLAYHMGAKRIILLGFDMRVGYGQTSHFTDDVNEAQPWRYKDTYIPAFSQIAIDLNEAGVPVLNATPKSALETFPKVDLADVL